MTFPSSIKIEGVSIPTANFIGGEWQEASSTFVDYSPIDSHLLAEMPASGPVEVNAAVEAARSAFPEWARLTPQQRAKPLLKMAEIIRERNDSLAAVETEDTGTILLGNKKRVIKRAAYNLEFFANKALEIQGRSIESETVINTVRYDPSGVAALITPWNAPFMLSTWKVGPALAAGNTVVLKPPEWAPLSCSLLAEMSLEAGIPPGVLNVVHGIGEEAGAALVSNPLVSRVSFTGSTETGRQIASTAAANLVPVSCELGGKSPFIVFDDADLELASKEIAVQFHNAGEVCLAGTRLLVQSSIAKELEERVVKAVEALPVGNPRLLSTRVGPLITKEHFERVDGFVKRAIQEGARAMIGGGPHQQGGLYYSPTILTDVAQDSEIIQNEVFGPVLTWQLFSEEEEAVELANGTRYGLAAMVFTTDAARARRVAEQLVAGTVWVNCFFIRDLAAPFGGSRISGIGREGGTWSFDFYCDVKNIATRIGTLK